MKTMLSIFLCLLFTSIWADPPEKQIEKLIFNIFEGDRQNTNIVAPDFDTIIIKLLGESYSTGRINLTEKLFFYELTQLLAPAKNDSVYTLMIYPLAKVTAIHKREKIITNETNNSSLNSSLRTFLVMISIGKDYPKEKILFIAMRKYKESFIIEPNACVFGSDSFFHFSGFRYNKENKTFYWEKDKKDDFVQYLDTLHNGTSH